MACILRLMNVMKDDSALWYKVDISNGFRGTYPYVWLRDNCRCSQCYHPSSGQRSSLMADLDPDVVPFTEELADEDRTLRITWSDQHRSDFQADWLTGQRFSESERDVVGDPVLQAWGAEMNGNIPKFEFQKLLQDDMELYNWLDVLNTRGLALLTGAPTVKGTVRKLAEKVAYLKQTMNGMEWQVESRSDSVNLAFTTNELGFHVDQPYKYSNPGPQMLHCITRTSDVEGGENQFVDGLRIAEQLKEEFPAAYKLLTTRPIDFRTFGTDFVKAFDQRSRVPIIQCKENGEFKQINYSHIVRAPCMPIPVEEITEMYRAMKLFHQVMHRPSNVVRITIFPGDIITFNNIRLLHARMAYTVTGNGTRHLEGGYLDWDETHSRMRVLRKALKIDN